MSVGGVGQAEEPDRHSAPPPPVALSCGKGACVEVSSCWSKQRLYPLHGCPKPLRLDARGIGRSFVASRAHSNSQQPPSDHEQASFIRIKLQWGGASGWVGLKLWTPPPLMIPRVSWVGLQPPLLSLVLGALSGWLLVPLSALLLCRHHAKRVKKKVFSPHVFILHILGIFRRIYKCTKMGIFSVIPK